MSKDAADATEVVGVQASTTISRTNEETQPNQGSTTKKRVSQACRRCRSRKDKCDGKKPACTPCATANEVCVYDPPTKKRGLPEGYVRGIEKLWGVSLRKSEGLEESILRILAEETADPARFETFAFLWNEKEEGETLLETWRNSHVFKELERLLPFLDISDEKSGKRKRADFVPTQVPELTAPPMYMDFARPPAAGSTSQPEDNHRPSLTSQISPLPLRTSVTQSPRSLPSSTWQLIDIFFSYTHCWFPIIEKPDLLRISYQYPADGTFAANTQTGDHAILWAILAYSAQQSPALLSSANSHPPLELGGWTPNKLYAEAGASIPGDEGDFDIGHVQGLLVLTLLNMGMGRWNRAWLLVGQAARITICLGLGDGGQDPQVQSRSRRVFLCCLTLDTLVALRLQRRPQLHVSDLKVQKNIEEDGLDEWSPWSDALSMERRPADRRPGPAAVASTFNRLVTLVQVLNNILHDDSSGLARANKCQRLLHDLKSWDLPTPNSLSSIPNFQGTKMASLLPHQYHLYLAFNGTMAAVTSHALISSPDSWEFQSSGDVISTAAYQAMWLLERYNEAYGSSIVPPTFDCFISIILRAFGAVQPRVTGDNPSYAEWQEHMLCSLSNMNLAWPTFDSLKPTVRELHHRPGEASRHSAFPDPRTAIRTQWPSNERTVPPVPTQTVSSYRSQPGYTAPSQTQPQPPPPPSFARSISSDHVPAASSAASNHAPARTWGHVSDQPIAEFRNVPNPFVSPVDGDSTFNEFAALDALEW
jgi:hypothetical protein